jgi:hypothetical protein
MRRPPGRPPLDPTDRSVRLSVSVTASTYDAIYLRAKTARMTISEFVRHRLEAPAVRPAAPPDAARICRIK